MLQNPVFGVHQRDSMFSFFFGGGDKKARLGGFGFSKDCGLDVEDGRTRQQV